jgi:prolyl 4-hydroxylase
MQAFRPDDFHKLYHSERGSERPHITREDDAGVCMDTHVKCVEWAAAGECTKNPMYMVGVGSDAAGACRKACGLCEVCSYGDAACYHRNRNKAGYLDLTEEVKHMTGRDLPVQY